MKKEKRKTKEVKPKKQPKISTLDEGTTPPNTPKKPPIVN